MKLRYVLLVTGPAYGTEQASAALLFARALLSKGQKIRSIFFYCDGVSNGNLLVSPASDEYDIVREWVKLAQIQGTELAICVSAALRRGVVGAEETTPNSQPLSNLQSGFTLSGLGSLAEAILNCDRFIQF